MISSKSKDEECFKYVLISPLHFGEVNNHTEKNQNNWEKNRFAITLKKWKRFEMNNKNVPLIILFTNHSGEHSIEIKQTYICKHE